MIPLLVRIGALLALFASIVMIGHILLNLVLTRRAERRQINERLELLRTSGGEVHDAALLRADRNLHGANGSTLYARMCRVIARAEQRVPPQMVLLYMGICAFALAAVLLVLASSSNYAITFGTLVLVSTFSIALAFGMPLAYFSRKSELRRKRLEEQFPAAVEIFTRALRAGHPLTAALALLTEEMEDPIGSEFGLVADEVAYGADLGNSLASLAQRWDLPDIRMFAVCLSVQSETGGNLAEILTNLNAVIRERSSLFLMVRALSSEGRISAILMSILPVMTFLLLFAVNPAFYLDVASEPMFTQGYVMLLIGYAIGVFWIRRMVDLKV